MDVIEKIVTTYMFILLDKEYAATLVWWERDTIPPAHNITVSDDFRAWANGLRGTYKVHAVSVEPHLISGGEDELIRLHNRLSKWDEHRTLPMTLRRWQFSFTDETDAIMFKMRWL